MRTSISVNLKTMTKRLVLLAVLLGAAPVMDTAFIAAGGRARDDYAVEVSFQSVYYCTGPQARKYHRKANCRGLKKCSCRIVKCSKAEAQKKGFSPCRICY